MVPRSSYHINDRLDRLCARAIGLVTKHRADGWYVQSRRGLVVSGPWQMHGNALSELARIGHELRARGIVTPA